MPGMPNPGAPSAEGPKPGAPSDPPRPGLPRPCAPNPGIQGYIAARCGGGCGSLLPNPATAAAAAAWDPR